MTEHPSHAQPYSRYLGLISERNRKCWFCGADIPGAGAEGPPRRPHQQPDTHRTPSLSMSSAPPCAVEGQRGLRGLVCARAEPGARTGVRTFQTREWRPAGLRSQILFPQEAQLGESLPVMASTTLARPSLVLAAVNNQCRGTPTVTLYFECLPASLRYNSHTVIVYRALSHCGGKARLFEVRRGDRRQGLTGKTRPSPPESESKCEL